MRAAVLAPMPGSAWSSVALAVLMLSGAASAGLAADRGVACDAAGVCARAASGGAAAKSMNATSDRTDRTIGSLLVCGRGSGWTALRDRGGRAPRRKLSCRSRAATRGGKARTATRRATASRHVIRGQRDRPACATARGRCRARRSKRRRALLERCVVAGHELDGDDGAVGGAGHIHLVGRRSWAAAHGVTVAVAERRQLDVFDAPRGRRLLLSVHTQPEADGRRSTSDLEKLPEQPLLPRLQLAQTIGDAMEVQRLA